MPVFNGEQWLQSSINSILNQTYKNIEFIIVSDGSSDGSNEIIKRNSKKDKRIKCLLKKHTGHTNTLNIGVQHATGKWIARIDCDDIAAIERLEKQMQYCSNNKQLGLVGANGYFINHDSQIFDSFTYPEHHKELWRGLIKKNTGFFPHSSAFFNKQLFLKAGGYRKSFKTAQDYDLWLRMGTICQIGCLQSPLAFIRKHNRQISFQRMGRQQLVDSFIALISYYLRQTKN